MSSKTSSTVSDESVLMTIFEFCENPALEEKANVVKQHKKINVFIMFINVLPISHKEIVKFRFHKFTFWLVNYLINQAGGGVLNCPGLSSIPHFFLWLLHNDFSSFFFKFCFVSVFYYVKNVFQFLMFIKYSIKFKFSSFFIMDFYVNVIPS